MRARLKGLAFAPTQGSELLRTGARLARRTRLPPISPAVMGSTGRAVRCGGRKTQRAAKAQEREQKVAKRTALPCHWTLCARCLKSASISKIGHNVKPLEIMLERGGVDVAPFAFDVLIAAYLLEAGRSSYPLL